MAKFISDYAKLKSTKKNDNDKSKDPEYLLNAPIGMLIGTPSEILQHIEEGNVVCDDIKYLVSAVLCALNFSILSWLEKVWGQKFSGELYILVYPSLRLLYASNSCKIV